MAKKEKEADNQADEKEAAAALVALKSELHRVTNAPQHTLLSEMAEAYRAAKIEELTEKIGE